MSLEDVVEGKGGVVTDNPYRTYPKDEWEDKMWEWFEEMEELFPEPIECDFIEVSHRITSCHARAFYRKNPRSVYIRVSKGYIKRSYPYQVKRTLLHEMVHLYTYQNGYQGKIHDSSPVFKWLCGSVGTTINSVSTSSGYWSNLMEPMVDSDIGVTNR